MNKIKRIAFLGNFTVDYCTEVHHAKTYERLEIEVIRLQEGVTTVAQIREAMKTCDAFNWTHTHGWKTEGVEVLLAELKEQGKPTYGYHLDLWLGIAREKDLETDPFWQVQYFFSVDPDMVALLNSRADMPKAFYLPAGVFEDECYMAKPNYEKYPHEVIFVGSKGYHPEWPYRPQLIEWLQKTYKSSFAQYGGGGLPTIRGHELNVLYASAKVVVGDTLCPNFTKPYYLSDRVFETTGRGGFLIHPYVEGINCLFNTYRLGKNISNDVTELVSYEYGNFEQLKLLIDLFCMDDMLRTAVQQKGHERTKRDHTYTQRLTKLIQTLENESGN